MPELHIITGSNGAGKSTVGIEYIPSHIRSTVQVFNGDKLFQEKKKELWKQGIKAIKESRNIAAEFVETTFDTLSVNALKSRSDFAYEGHFTNESTWEVPMEFKTAGYSIHLIFFGLTDTDLSQLRVIDRTNEGGHYVSPIEVQANFYGNLEKLDKHFRMFDTVQIIDTSEAEHMALATFTNGDVYASIQIDQLPEWFMLNLPQMAEKIREWNS